MERKTFLIVYLWRGSTLADVYTDAHTTQISVNVCLCSSQAYNCKHTKHLKSIGFCESLCLLRFYSSCYYQHLILLSTYTLTSPLLDPLHGRYNPDTDSWSTDVAPLSSPRSGVCLVAMDGYLYAIGGHDGIAAINTVERYYSMSGTKDQYLTKLTVNPLNACCGRVQDISLGSTNIY